MHILVDNMAHCPCMVHVSNTFCILTDTKQYKDCHSVAIILCTQPAMCSISSLLSIRWVAVQLWRAKRNTENRQFIAKFTKLYRTIWIWWHKLLTI